MKTCMACGQRVAGDQAQAIDYLLCCRVDPRHTGFDRTGYRSVREPGEWCRWCGDEVPVGQSFCSRACGLSYADDVEDDAARAVARAKAGG